jgi:hypothetical protein
MIPVSIAIIAEQIRALLAPTIAQSAAALVTLGQTLTGHFFAADGARINRLADRLLVGPAVLHNGSTYGNGDWLSSGGYDLRWPVYGAQIATLSSGGTLAISGASRAADLLNSYGSLQTTIGVCGVAINDDVFATSARHCTVYGGYFEGMTRVGSSGLAFGIEVDAVNFGAATPLPTPYAALQWPGTYAVWAAAGGEHDTPVYDVGFAYGIGNNGAKFKAGIVFTATSLAGTDGVTGYGIAMSLAKGHRLVWHAPNGQESAYITSTVVTPANAMSLQFADGGPLFINSAGNAVASVQQVTNAVNGVALTPSIAGSPAAISTFGNDTNVGLTLAPKGGAASFVYTAAPISAAGGLSVTGGLSVSTGGIAVSAGATSLQAVTGTTATFTGAVQVNSGLVLNGGGPTINVGAGVPVDTQPKGSIRVRSDGTVGSTLYISQGGGTWNAVAGV